VFARIVTYTADPSPRLQSATVANIEQGLRRTWERLPGVRQLEGIEGAYLLCGSPARQGYLHFSVGE
jgi:hypothetical protein